MCRAPAAPWDAKGSAQRALRVGNCEQEKDTELVSGTSRSFPVERQEEGEWSPWGPRTTSGPPQLPCWHQER